MTSPLNVLLCLLPKMLFNRSARFATKWPKMQYADLYGSLSILKNCSYFHIDFGKINKCMSSYTNWFFCPLCRTLNMLELSSLNFTITLMFRKKIGK
jgi:hypothetical protein